VSVSVRRTGAEPFDRSWGSTNAGAPAAADTPFVIASASKLITALAIARLVEAGQLDIAAPVPWAAMGIAHHPAWDDVTPSFACVPATQSWKVLAEESQTVPSRETL
jgi:hypothetical protein